MKKLAVGLLAALACADSGVPTEPETPLFARGGSGNYIVTTKGEPRGVANAHGLSPDFVYTSALNGFAARIPAQALAGLERNPNVLRIEPDGVVTLHGEQANPVWGLDRIDQRKAPLDGWYRFGRCGSGVHAYVLDSGINTSHVEFTGRIGAGADMTGSGSIEDALGHGSHVSGTLGGTTYGVAKCVTIHPVRAFVTGSTPTSVVIAGVDWITANAIKPAVANGSFGDPLHLSLNAAVSGSIASGITWAVSAGNNGYNGLDPNACNYSPASVPEALTVANLTMTGADGYHSLTSNSGPCVDLYAPGTHIVSAWVGSSNATWSTTGTSMAAPHVVGAAAKVLEGNPAATPQQVHDAIVAHATVGRVKFIPTSDTPNRLLMIGAVAGGSTPPPEDCKRNPQGNCVGK